MLLDGWISLSRWSSTYTILLPKHFLLDSVVGFLCTYVSLIVILRRVDLHCVFSSSSSPLFFFLCLIYIFRIENKFLTQLQLLWLMLYTCILLCIRRHSWVGWHYCPDSVCEEQRHHLPRQHVRRLHWVAYSPAAQFQLCRRRCKHCTWCGVVWCDAMRCAMWLCLYVFIGAIRIFYVWLHCIRIMSPFTTITTLALHL